MTTVAKKRLQRVNSTCRVVVLALCCPFLLTALANGNGGGPRGAGFDLSWYTLDAGGTSTGGGIELSAEQKVSG